MTAILLALPLRFRRWLGLPALLMIAIGTDDAAAGPASSVFRETAELVTRKFGKEAASEGVEAVARRIAVLAAKHGDEAVLTAVKRCGPASLRAIENAGVRGGSMARLIGRHGDDALVWVAHNPKGMQLFVEHGEEAAVALAKHKAIAEPLIERFGRQGATTLAALEPQGARRLAMLAEAGHLDKIGRTPELLSVIERFGDRGMAFVHGHWKELTVAATLAAFLADPEPFIDGAREITAAVTDAAVRPLAEVPGEVADKIADGVARKTNWTWVMVAVVGFATGFLAWCWHVRRRGRLLVSAALGQPNAIVPPTSPAPAS